MKLDLGILVGAESKQWLADLTKQLDRLEKILVAQALAPQVSDAPEEEEDEDFAAPKAATTKKKAKAPIDEDEEDEVAAEVVEVEVEVEEDEEEDEPAPKKATKTKAKKIGIDDINDACKARARAGGKKGRAEVLAILKKKFKTESVSDLEEDQYQACIDAMAVEG